MYVIIHILSHIMKHQGRSFNPIFSTTPLWHLSFVRVLRGGFGHMIRKMVLEFIRWCYGGFYTIEGSHCGFFDTTVWVISVIHKQQAAGSITELELIHDRLADMACMFFVLFFYSFTFALTCSICVLPMHPQYILYVQWKQYSDEISSTCLSWYRVADSA